MRDLLIQANLVPGVGSAGIDRLIERFENVDALRRAGPEALADALGMSASLAARVRRDLLARSASAEERAAQRIGAAISTRADAGYPRRLAETVGPPAVLYTRGDPRALEGPAVAIVGSRTPTPYGLRIAREMGRDLALRGVNVVSGMALGIDGAAHRGALEALAGRPETAGRTIAVLGCGIDVCYPRSHRSLHDEIVREGMVVSEYALGVIPLPRNFPRRNRIISGLADAVVVVEAAFKSGSLITASLAAEQGREVFAVPGPVTSDRSEGTHALLRQGAALVHDVSDLFEVLGWGPPGGRGESPSSPHGPPPELGDDERRVLDRVGPEPVSTDRVAVETALEPERLAGILTMLELKDLIRDVGGGRVVRA